MSTNTAGTGHSHCEIRRDRREGATPKLLVAITAGGSQIIIGSDKIPTRTEARLIKLKKKHAPLIQLEHVYFVMAKAAGLRVPRTKLLQDAEGMLDVAIRRYDRGLDTPNTHIHIPTDAAIARIDSKESTSDYEALLGP